MARRSSRGSVYNKRVNEQVQVAKTKKKTETKVVKKVERQVKQAKTVKYQNQQSSSSGNTGGGGIIPQAHAQVQSQSPQARTQTTQYDPLARVAQFAHNVGRGAVDTGKSYTTDFYDMAEATVTGRQRADKSYQDETLLGVFGRGLFEGNLGGAVDEAGRRITHEPGRVVGEVATETAIMLGTMGFGAALKGVRIGATGAKAGQQFIKAKSTAGVSKTKIGKDKVLGNKRVSGYERNTSRLSPFNRGGKEFISGDFKKGHTLTIKTNKQGKETAKLTKDLSITGWTRGITSRSTSMGKGLAQRAGRAQNVFLPMRPFLQVGAKGSKPIDDTGDLSEIGKLTVSKGNIIKTESLKFSDIDSPGATGYMKQYEQFQLGQLPREYVPGKGYNISSPQKQAGLFEGIGETARSPTKGVIEFDTPVERIGGMSEDLPIKKDWTGYKQGNSGGQGGMDQLATITASEQGLTTGGWMPKGFETIGGGGKEFAKKFGLRENDVVGYPARTRKNIAESDITVVFYDGKPGRGTQLTINEAKRQGKPLLENPTADQINILGKEINAETINFAGPRASDLTQGAKDRATRAIRGMKVSTSKDITKTTFSLDGILLKANTLTDPVFGSVTQKIISNTREAKANTALPSFNQKPIKSSTEAEWIKAYSDEIESMKEISADNEIIRPVNEPGILGKYSTDETIRTHGSPFISDKSGAVREAEIIIKEGFDTGKGAASIESALANMFSRYATTSAKEVKTNIRTVARGKEIISGDGFYNPENIGLGTDVGSKGVVAKSNIVENILPSLVGIKFKESTVNIGQLEAIGRVSTYGKGTSVPVTESSKTGMKRYWEVIKQDGGRTNLEKGITGEDKIKSGTSQYIPDITEWLASHQHDFVRINKKGELVGNPQLGLSKEVNDKKIAQAMSNILGPIEEVGTKWTKKGDRIKHFGYTDFKNKYNAGKLKAQNGVVPKRKLPARLSTFKEERNLTDKMYNDLAFQQRSRTSNPSQMKKFIDGDVEETEYTGGYVKESLYTKANIEAAGGGMEIYNRESLPYSLLGREFKISARPRVPAYSKDALSRYSNWRTIKPSKTIIEKADDISVSELVLRNVRKNIAVEGSIAIAKRVSKPTTTRRLRTSIPKPKKRKEEKVKVYTGSNAFRKLWGDTSNSLVNDPKTGIPDNTLVDRSFRIPSWFIGGGDNTRVGGGIISKGKPTWMGISFSTAKPPKGINVKSIGKATRGKKRVGRKVKSKERSFSERTVSERKADAKLFDMNYNLIEDIRLKNAFLQL